MTSPPPPRRRISLGGQDVNSRPRGSDAAGALFGDFRRGAGARDADGAEEVSRERRADRVQLHDAASPRLVRRHQLSRLSSREPAVTASWFKASLEQRVRPAGALNKFAFSLPPYTTARLKERRNSLLSFRAPHPRRLVFSELGHATACARAAASRPPAIRSPPRCNLSARNDTKV